MHCVIGWDHTPSVSITRAPVVLRILCLSAPVNVAISRISCGVNITTLLPYIVRVLFGPLPRLFLLAPYLLLSANYTFCFCRLYIYVYAGSESPCSTTAYESCSPSFQGSDMILIPNRNRYLHSYDRKVSVSL